MSLCNPEVFSVSSSKQLGAYEGHSKATASCFFSVETVAATMNTITLVGRADSQLQKTILQHSRYH